MLAATAVTLFAIRAPSTHAAEAEISPTSQALERLGITAPWETVEKLPIQKQLEILAREKCDSSAIDALGQELSAEGYKRDAANAHVRFASECGGRIRSFETAASIFITLADAPQAVAVADEIVKREPFNHKGYYLRARANDLGDEPAKAIDDYTTSIELFGNKSQISSSVYLALARAHEKLGQFCEAVGPIETWVALDPSSNDTTQTRAIIANYIRQGQCANGVSGKTEVFAARTGANVTVVQASINGVRGNFIIDTGATAVAVTKSFADKAKVVLDAKSSVLISTANGISTAQRGNASKIELRSLKAANVQVLVQADTKAAFGEKIDGLLGMSFLSRFNLAMDAHTVKISALGGSETAPAATGSVEKLKPSAPAASGPSRKISKPHKEPSPGKNTPSIFPW